MKLRHYFVLAMCLGMLSCHSAVDPGADTSEPNGIKGTYTDEVLRNDAMLGVYMQIATKGCEEVDSVQPYVVEQPTGTAGEMNWKERWIVRGCEEVFDITMRFKEDGAGGASFHISMTE